MLPEFSQFYIPTRVVAGSGVIKTLGEEILYQELGQKAFLITDTVMVNKGFADLVCRGLEEYGVEVAGTYCGVKPDSGIQLVEEAADRYRESGAGVLLALGGGSVIDTAKGANLLYSLGGNLRDYEGVGLVTRPLKPLVAIPTTAGTGSEVTQYMVIKDDAAKTKLSFLSPYLGPQLAVLDPELTLDMPARLAAETGMDALTHAIEAYVSTAASPLADGLALQAVAMIARYYLPSVQDALPDARYGMLMASNIAGMAFTVNMIGCVHAMAHACGGLYGVPHGLANAILLPYGMRYNREAAAERFQRIAFMLGVEKAHHMDALEAAAAGEEKVREMIRAAGLPQKLREVGVPREGLPEVATAAIIDGAMYTNPREADETEILSVLEEAY